MLDTLMLLLAGAAGFAGASWWLVPLAAAGLTIEGWWEKGRLLLRQQPRVLPSSKIVTYFVTGVVANLGYCALSFLCGRIVRSLFE